MTCPLALCTCLLDAQVGQEGIGEADQMQVCHGRPVRAILVLTEPSNCLTSFSHCSTVRRLLIARRGPRSYLRARAST